LDKTNEFKGRTRIYFTYDESIIEAKHYKRISNGLYVIVNSNC